MIFALEFGAPRLRMNAQPCFTFRFPSRAQIVRHGISQSKRNEIRCAILLPMRQAIRSETNLRVRIEETQFDHGQVYQEAALKTPKISRRISKKARFQF